MVSLCWLIFAFLIRRCLKCFDYYIESFRSWCLTHMLIQSNYCVRETVTLGNCFCSVTDSNMRDRPELFVRAHILCGSDIKLVIKYYKLCGHLYNLMQTFWASGPVTCLTDHERNHSLTILQLRWNNMIFGCCHIGKSCIYTLFI